MQGNRKKKKLYTACNIWVHSYMKCINYKMGGVIPAGTEVSGVRSGYDDQDLKCYIYFKTEVSKKEYKLEFKRMWHPGKRMKDYKNYLFTEKTFNEIVKGMNETEIRAMMLGKVVVGMSKKAVLVSYGRPPEHRTPDLKSDKWRYWINKRKQKTICFHKGLTLRCSDLKKLQEKLTDEL